MAGVVISDVTLKKFKKEELRKSMTLSYDTVNRKFLKNGGLANGGFHKMVIST